MTEKLPSLTDILSTLERVPQRERPQCASKLCVPPDTETADLFRDAGLIALGICATKRERVVIYQMTNGRLGTADL